ncbi:MAG TPA: hypothetical protein VFG10_19580 [Saprospiraceae bacterium]|nr:hypothetical protein [Saprospiraceae bacterium]
MKKANRLLIIFFIMASAMMNSGVTYAQCPMCHLSAESNLAHGGSTGKGLNAGILYMLALPYSVVGVFGIILWRNSRRQREDELEVLP